MERTLLWPILSAARSVFDSEKIAFGTYSQHFFYHLIQNQRSSSSDKKLFWCFIFIPQKTASNAKE